MTRSIQPTRKRRGARAVAAFAALAAAGATLPMVGASAAAATTTSCAAPTGLASDDALRGPAAQLKDVRLAWQPIAGASGYELEVSPDQDFSNNIFVDTTTVSTRYNVPPTVLKPSSYFWRVRVAGANCWSDDGGSSASQFSVAWTESPVAVSPSGTVSSSNLNFSWDAIQEASAYEVELDDATTGQLVGRCITTHTNFTPYDEVSNAAERIPVSSECIANNAIGFRRPYTWRVRGLDTTGTTLNGKPYPYVAQQAIASAPKTGQHGSIVVTHVYPYVNNAVDTADGTIGSAGTKIAIAGFDGGYGFTGADTVTIGGVPATVSGIDSATGDIIATVPNGVAGGVVDAIVSDTPNSSVASASDQFLEAGGSVSIGANETFPQPYLANGRATRPSSRASRPPAAASPHLRVSPP